MSHGEQQPPSFAASSLGMGRVDVFAKGEGGYFCLRIPSLTAIGGGAAGGGHSVLLATAEARSGSSCSDYDQTALVYKRSLDGGATWGSLGVIYQEFNGTNNPVTIGNAAPVALGGGRVLMSFNRKNLDVFLTASDDAGATWSKPRQILAGKLPADWKWLGLGPPGSLVLSSTGRIVVPVHHAATHDPPGPPQHAAAIYSDDRGLTWSVGKSVPGWDYWTNEAQLVELGPGGHLGMNARGFLTRRLWSESRDGGATWDAPRALDSLVEPFAGCEGSTILLKNKRLLLFTGPNSTDVELRNMSLAVRPLTSSFDSWSHVLNIDPGRSAYSALTETAMGEVGLLYERSNQTAHDLIFVPDFISYVRHLEKAIRNG